jgi:hypothetical protein
VSRDGSSLPKAQLQGYLHPGCPSDVPPAWGIDREWFHSRQTHASRQVTANAGLRCPVACHWLREHSRVPDQAMTAGNHISQPFLWVRRRDGVDARPMSLPSGQTSRRPIWPERCSAGSGPHAKCVALGLGHGDDMDKHLLLTRTTESTQAYQHGEISTTPSACCIGDEGLPN